MAPYIRYLAGMASALAALCFASDAALACACCSNRAARNVGVETFGEFRLNQIEQMTFAEGAFLAESAADHPVELEDLGTTLQLAVERTSSEMVFTFRGDSGRATSLTLAMPQTISIFEIDPRDGKDEGLGPVLYKEWQLTGNATATGVLEALIGKSRTVSLILHGRGRGCIDATDFTDWTLQIGGPAGKVIFYGALTSAR